MSSATPNGSATTPSVINDVNLGTGPPTLEELQVYYKPLFTWDQFKLFVNSGCGSMLPSLVSRGRS